MAIQKDTQYIGTFGNLIFYKWMGLYCIRTLPSSVRQSEPTKQAALNFGKVSSRSKMIRDHFAGFIAAPKDKEMQKRLKKVLLEGINLKEPAIGELQSHPLNFFRFNEALLLEQCLGFKMQISERAQGGYTVGIPSINPLRQVKAPRGISRMQVEISAFSFSFDHEQTSGSTAVILNIPYTNETHAATYADLNIVSEKPCLVLLAARLTYWNRNLRLDVPGYNPAEVIGVF